jgi:hypothetical protein
MAAPRILGEIACYADLHQLMRARCDELELTRASLDRLARLPAGYAAKLLCPKPMKRLSDETLGFAMPALGMKLVVVEDLQALETLRARSDKRKAVTVLGTTIKIEFSRRELKRRQRHCGKTLWKNVSQKERAKHARHMNRIRWACIKAVAGHAAGKAGAAAPPVAPRLARPKRSGGFAGSTRPAAGPRHRATGRARPKRR